MLVAAAVCPSQPQLVRAAATDAAPEQEPLRAACAEALRVLLAADPELVVVVGVGGSKCRVHEEGALGSIRGYGEPLHVRLGRVRGEAPPADRLPLSLTVGAWLLEQAGWTGPVRAYELPDDRDWPANGEDGTHIAGWADRVGLLVMGEGTACRSVTAPGYPQERAEAVDAAIAVALAQGDEDGFFPDLDGDLARELQVSGRSPWQLLDGADDDSTTHRLLYTGAPYGVGCFVATWT